MRTRRFKGFTEECHGWPVFIEDRDEGIPDENEFDGAGEAPCDENAEDSQESEVCEHDDDTYCGEST